MYVKQKASFGGVIQKGGVERENNVEWAHTGAGATRAKRKRNRYIECPPIL
jgi:hypothetical protein